MKLMLSSSGLSTPKLRKEFSKLLLRKISDARVLVLHTVEDDEDLKYVAHVGEELVGTGFLHSNINDQ